MEKVPVRMMMAWIWLGLVAVVRLSTAEEPPRDAAETLAELEALWSDSEPPKEPRSGEDFLPVSVWRFVEVPDAPDSLDLGRPQFGCSDTSLSVRLSLIRHSGLRLQDGGRWLSVEEGCRGSVRSVGSWLLLKIPYTSCHVELLTVNGSRHHQLKVRYLDHLLQANVTAVAACKDPAGSLYPETPLVRCRATDVTVKLPLGSGLKRVRALGKGDVVGSVLTTSTPDAVLVQISTAADKDSFLEIIYLDSAGEMFSMLAACLKAGVDTERTRQRRDLLKLHIKDLWDHGYNPARQYELNQQQDVLHPDAPCKGPQCKYMTPSPLPDCDDVTLSPLPDCDDVTLSPLPDCDDVTLSPLPDCDDVTLSPLPDCDDVTLSPLPDCDDVTLSPLPDCDEVTLSPLPDCDDVTLSPLPDCEEPTNVTICGYISVITRLVKVGGSLTSLVSLGTLTRFSNIPLADVGSGSTLAVTGSSQAFTDCVGDGECLGVVGVIHNVVRVKATIPGSVDISDAVGNAFAVSGFIRFGFVPSESGSVPVVFVCAGVSGVMDGLSDIGGSDGNCFQTIITGDDGLLNNINERLPNLCFRQSFFGTNGPQFETHVGCLDDSGACSNISNGCFGLDSVFSGFIESSCGVSNLLGEDGSFNVSLSNDTCCLDLNATCCSDQNVTDKTSCSCSCGLGRNCCNLSFPDSSSDINCAKTNFNSDTFCNIASGSNSTHVPFCGGLNGFCGFGCNTSLVDCLTDTCCNSTSSLDMNSTCFGPSDIFSSEGTCSNVGLPDCSSDDSFCTCDLNFSGVPGSCDGCNVTLTGCQSSPCLNSSGSNTACCDLQNSSGQGVSNGFGGSSCLNVKVAGSGSDGTSTDGSTVAYAGCAFVGTRSCDDMTTTTPPTTTTPDPTTTTTTPDPTTTTTTPDPTTTTTTPDPTTTTTTPDPTTTTTTPDPTTTTTTPEPTTTTTTTPEPTTTTTTTPEPTTTTTTTPEPTTTTTTTPEPTTTTTTTPEPTTTTTTTPEPTTTTTTTPEPTTTTTPEPTTTTTPEPTTTTTTTTPEPTTTTTTPEPTTTTTTPEPTTTTTTPEPTTTTTTPEPTTTTTTTPEPTTTTPPPTTVPTTQAPTDVTLCFIFRIITRLVNVDGLITSLCSVATITSFSADGGVADGGVVGDSTVDVTGFNRAITIPSCTANGDSSDISVIQSVVSVSSTVPSSAVNVGVMDNSFVRFGCLVTEVGRVPAIFVCAGFGGAIDGSGVGALSNSCFPVILPAGDRSSDGNNEDSSCFGFQQSVSGTNRTLFNTSFSTLYSSSACNMSSCFGGGGLFSGVNGPCLNDIHGNCSSPTVCLSLNGSCCGSPKHTADASCVPCGCSGLIGCNGTSGYGGSKNTYCSNGTSYSDLNSLYSVVGNISVFNCSYCNSSMGISGIDGCSGVSNGTLAMGGPCCNQSQTGVDCPFTDMLNGSCFGLDSQCCGSSNCSDLDCCCSGVLGGNIGSGCTCNTSLTDCNGTSVSNQTYWTDSCNASATNCTSNDTCCGSFGVGVNLTDCSNGTFCNSTASNSSCVANGSEPCCSGSLTNCTSNHTAGNDSSCGSSLSASGGACCGFSNGDGACSWWDLISCCFLRSLHSEPSPCPIHGCNHAFKYHHHHYAKQHPSKHYAKQHPSKQYVKQHSSKQYVKQHPSKQYVKQHASKQYVKQTKGHHIKWQIKG